MKEGKGPEKNRREFLKGMSIVGGAAATAGAGYIVEKSQHEIIEAHPKPIPESVQPGWIEHESYSPGYYDYEHYQGGMVELQRLTETVAVEDGALELIRENPDAFHFDAETGSLRVFDPIPQREVYELKLGKGDARFVNILKGRDDASILVMYQRTGEAEIHHVDIHRRLSSGELVARKREAPRSTLK